jgi:hypothetical protein
LSAAPQNSQFVDDRRFLTREARAYLARITERSVEQLIAGQILTLSAVAYASFSFNQAGEVTAATAANPTGTDAQVVVYVVPNGESPAAQYIVVSFQDVPALSSVSLTGLINQAIPPGASIYAYASVADTVTLTVSGVRRAQ